MTEAERIIFAQSGWVRVSERLPDEGVVVDTLSEGGQMQPLSRVGKLWLYHDYEGYVYYTPQFWRPKQ